MRGLRAIWMRLVARVLWQGGRRGSLAEELEGHLQMHIDDNVRAGMTEKEARRQALINPVEALRAE